MSEERPRATVEVLSSSAAETRRLGRCLGSFLSPGDLVLLAGPFGAGKTTFTHGIARALGIAGPVTSPSFTLVNEYRGDNRRPLLYHIDLYRVNGPAEAFDLGLDEYLAGRAVCVIEWPGQSEALLPGARLEIDFTYLGHTGRTLKIAAFGDRAAGVADAFRERCLRPKAGGTDPVGEEAKRGN